MPISRPKIKEAIGNVRHTNVLILGDEPEHLTILYMHEQSRKIKEEWKRS